VIWVLIIKAFFTGQGIEVNLYDTLVIVFFITTSAGLIAIITLIVIGIKRCATGVEKRIGIKRRTNDAEKRYEIYISPLLELEAVKEGWSWPATKPHLLFKESFAIVEFKLLK